MSSINKDVKYTLSLKDLLLAGVQKNKQAMNELDASVQHTQKSLGNLSTIARIARRALAGISLGLFARSVYDVGTGFENAQMGLKTLLKTTEAADDLFNKIRQDVVSTPFDFKSLLMANRALISAGENADASRVNVLNLANAIAASGGGNDELQRMVVNLQQIKNTGKATALDIKQFAYAGINIYGALAEATGKPIEKVREMEVSYDLLTMALAKARGEGGMFERGLENAMNTVSGKVSNLGDTFDMLKFKIFNMAKDGLPSAIDGFTTLIDYVSKWKDGNKENIATMGEFVKGVWDGLRPALLMAAGLFQFIFEISSMVMRAWNSLGTFGKVIIGTMAAIVAGVWLWQKAVIALKTAQIAYNFVAAIGAALVGNYAGLAAAGIIAVAGATWYLVDAQKASNEEAKKAGGTQTAKASVLGKKTPGSLATPEIPGPAAPKASPTAPKSTTISIRFENVVRELNLTNNTPQDLRRVADKVVELLTTTLNDSQRMSAQ